MRPEKLYLADIVEAAQAIARFVKDADPDEFAQYEKHQKESGRTGERESVRTRD